MIFMKKITIVPSWILDFYLLTTKFLLLSRYICHFDMTHSAHLLTQEKNQTNNLQNHYGKVDKPDGLKIGLQLLSPQGSLSYLPLFKLKGK